MNKLAVIGRGYVDIPLVVSFMQAGYDLKVFDTNARRSSEMRDGVLSAG